MIHIFNFPLRSIVHINSIHKRRLSCPLCLKGVVNLKSSVFQRAVKTDCDLKELVESIVSERVAKMVQKFLETNLFAKITVNSLDCCPNNEEYTLLPLAYLCGTRKGSGKSPPPPPQYKSSLSIPSPQRGATQYISKSNYRIANRIERINLFYHDFNTCHSPGDAYLLVPGPTQVCSSFDPEAFVLPPVC